MYSECLCIQSIRKYKGSFMNIEFVSEEQIKYKKLCKVTKRKSIMSHEIIGKT